MSGKVSHGSDLSPSLKFPILISRLRRQTHGGQYPSILLDCALSGKPQAFILGQTVFVAGDPQQVTVPPAPCHAPDVMVVFGRPDGERRSYKQWEEDNLAPQVVFE